MFYLLVPCSDCFWNCYIWTGLSCTKLPSIPFARNPYFCVLPVLGYIVLAFVLTAYLFSLKCRILFSSIYLDFLIPWRMLISDFLKNIPWSRSVLSFFGPFLYQHLRKWFLVFGNIITAGCYMLLGPAPVLHIQR